jgi:mono/diheme cytochrome c family protein
MFRRTRVELLSVAILPLGLGLAATDAPSDAAEAEVLRVAATAGPVSFARQVLPIFESTCADCHGAETQEVELMLTTYDDVMKGSEYGPVVEAGDPSASILLDMVSAGEMPQDAPALEADQIALIRTWIEQGAQDN